MSLDRSRFDRRTMLAAALATGGGAILAAASRGEGAGAAMAQFAARTKPAGSDLGAIEHVVFLMQENRSFDHYYGTYPGVRGFDDHPRGKLGNFAQAWPGGRDRTLLPFHLDSSSGMGECTQDLDHSWQGEHMSWGRGTNERLRQHARAVPVPGARARRPHHGLLPPAGPALLLRAGRRLHPVRQLPLLGARADAPEPPHGALGHRRPDGRGGRAGAHHQRVVRRRRERALGHHARGAGGRRGELEGLQPGGHHLHAESFFQQHGILSDAILPYFSQYQNPSSTLYQKAFLPQYPNDFISRHQVGASCPRSAGSSRPLGYDEHPSSPPALGEWFTSQVLAALVSNPEVWSKTVLFHMYDENDGFFDHVPPPVAPHGTPGEYVTVSPLPDEAHGTAGPIGMGFRVPMLVLSPFSRGGHVASEVFDHTSQLRFLEERFGVQGTQHLGVAPPHGGRPDVGAAPAARRPDRAQAAQHVQGPDGQRHGVGMHGGTSILEAAPASAMPIYPVPAQQSMPRQETA